jgi:hypothetical protein
MNECDFRIRLEKKLLKNLVGIWYPVQVFTSFVLKRVQKISAIGEDESFLTSCNKKTHYWTDRRGGDLVCSLIQGAVTFVFTGAWIPENSEI